MPVRVGGGEGGGGGGEGWGLGRGGLATGMESWHQPGRFENTHRELVVVGWLGFLLSSLPPSLRRSPSFQRTSAMSARLR